MPYENKHAKENTESRICLPCLDQAEPIINLINGQAAAIMPDKLEEIISVIEAKIMGENINFSKDSIGRSGNRAADSYEIRDKIAIIPVFGILAKRMNQLMTFSGGTSTQILYNDFLLALENPDINAIIFYIDSPGGSVDGIKDLVDLIYSSRGIKPIIAYGEGLMCSAAMWLGSACDIIFLNETAISGSIGVITTHYDFSSRDEKTGVKRTVITAGTYKAIISDEKPLSKKGKEYLQDMVDTYYSFFVNGLARNRDETVETILSKMADGKTFIGKKAQDVGLVDHIGNFEQAFNFTQIQGGKRMEINAEIVKTDHTETYDQIYQAGVASIDLKKEKETAAQKAVKEERARISSILKIDGVDFDLKQGPIDKGMSLEAAKAHIFDASKKDQKEETAEIEDSLPDTVLPAGKGKGEDTPDLETQIDAYLEKHPKSSYSQAAKIVVNQNQEVYEARI